MRTCCDKKPVLPQVRAILSWAVEPPAGMPDWPPVWGNRLERAIQIDPRSPLLCRFLDQFTTEGVQKIDPVLYAQIKAAMEAMPAAAKPAATLSKLQAEPNDDKLHALRHVFPAVVKLAAGNTDLAAWQVLKDAQIDLAPFDDFILVPKFNTTYEELHCVGLDRDLSLLHGIVQVKAPVRLLRRPLYRRAAASTSPSTSISAPAGNTRARPAWSCTTSPSRAAGSGTRPRCRSTSTSTG